MSDRKFGVAFSVHELCVITASNIEAQICYALTGSGSISTRLVRIVSWRGCGSGNCPYNDDMLRVLASRNAEEYYAESLKREDYYTERQEIRGEWQGIGAEKLGLSGAVNEATFHPLCENRKPGSNER